VHLSGLSEQKIAKLAQYLADSVQCPATVCLWGDLGVGKTTFSRSFINRLLLTDEDIPSPTFTLIQTYQTTKGLLWHCDLYRLKSPEEIEELGLIEAFYQTICLIEWPEKIKDYLPKNRIDVHLTIDSNQTRSVTVIAQGADVLPIMLLQFK
jgi:tRNA threonylcarbamoyl adenosine modification protein YjeE